MFTRYQQASRIVDLVRPRCIVEIGTWNGDHAVILASAALKRRTYVHYWGFDLFEEAALSADASEHDIGARCSLAAVHEKLTAFQAANPGFSFQLFRGDSKATLPAALSEQWIDPGDGSIHRLGAADFAYIAGGHALATIRSDHAHLQTCRTIVHDHYYEPDEAGRGPDIDAFGCNRVLEGSDHLVLPARDALPSGGSVRMAAAGPEIMRRVAAEQSRDEDVGERSGANRAVVTTFSLEGYYDYGKAFLQTFERFWPRDVALHVYSESPLPIEENARVRFVNLHRASPEIVEFKARHMANARAHGRADGRNEDYRFNAVKFCHKVFALTHAARNVVADTLYWIDADSVTFRPVPHRFLASLLPPGAYTSYLGRRAMHSECGFLAFDLRHPANAEFMDFFRQIYADDLVFDLPEWHDSYVYDVVRGYFEKQGRIVSTDLRAGRLDDHHPFVNSPLGAYMDHLIGPRRKAAGCSFAVDLREPRNELYWQLVPAVPEDLVGTAAEMARRRG